jgi:hypothetical protein
MTINSGIHAMLQLVPQQFEGDVAQLLMGGIHDVPLGGMLCMPVS